MTALTAVGYGTDQPGDMYQPVELRRADLPALAASVLSDREYLMALRISADYYCNSDVRRFPLPR